VSVDVSSHTGVLRRLTLCVAVGAVGAAAVAGASVVVHGKLEHIPSQPPRQKVATRAVTPPPIALPLVLQANPPVPSIAEPTSTTTKPTAKKPASTGKAKVKQHHPKTTRGTRRSR
jgi:hypothetical protein